MPATTATTSELDADARETAVELLCDRGFIITSGQEAGRTVVHTIGRFIGADWNLDGAVEFVRTADEVRWVDDFTGHCLHATKDGRFVRFDVPMPDTDGGR